LTNYAAAYATGLLLARRHLTKLGLASKYVGKADVDGEDFNVEPVKDGPRPFKANLDVGLVRTTTGHRVFAAMKGAVDGGINVPHNEKRLFGYNREKKALDTALLRKALLGGHVAEYMKKLSADEPARYQKQFSRYIKHGIKPDNVEQLYKKAHAAIREKPQRVVDPKRKTPEEYKKAAAPYRKKKLTLKVRKDRINNKLAKVAKARQ